MRLQPRLHNSILIRLCHETLNMLDSSRFCVVYTFSVHNIVISSRVKPICPKVVKSERSPELVALASESSPESQAMESMSSSTLLDQESELSPESSESIVKFRCIDSSFGR